MMKKKKKVSEVSFKEFTEEKKPKIRFAGFTDDWQQCKLGDMIIDIADGPFGSNLKTEHYTEEKEARIIQLSNLSDYGWQEENTRYTTFEHAKEIKRCIVNEGELVMGKMMPAGMTIMRPNTEKMYVLSSDCVRIKLNNDIVTDKFFLYTTKSNSFLNQVNNDSQGSTRLRTSISKIREMNINIPSIAEQEKIGEYFSNLDKLITLYQRKCDELKEVKKYMLQKMFPKNGETKPEIRFAGFTDDWQQRKVLELGEIYIGLVTTMTSHYTDHGALLIRNSDIKDSRFEFGKEPIYLDEEFARLNETRKHKIGDVITVHTGDIGTSAVITEKEAGSIGFATIVTRPNTRIITSDYLCTYLNTETHKNFAMNISTGDGRNNYNLKDYFKCVIPVPSIEEQQKISEYIKNLNNLITLNHRKCDELKELKKYMLQNMFPRMS